MVIDSLTNWGSYKTLVPYFEEAMEFALQKADCPAGRYDCGTLPEGQVYLLIQEGDTASYEDGLVEAHRRYMDVQIILSGGETVYYADIAGLKEAVAYDDKKDILFFEKAGQPLRITEGMFYAAFPQDGHMPCRHLDGPGRYRKLVVKIRVAS